MDAQKTKSQQLLDLNKSISDEELKYKRVISKKKEDLQAELDQWAADNCPFSVGSIAANMKATHFGKAMVVESVTGAISGNDLYWICKGNIISSKSTPESPVTTSWEGICTQDYGPEICVFTTNILVRKNINQISLTDLRKEIISANLDEAQNKIIVRQFHQLG